MIIILPEGKIAAGCEFNGDMYEGGHYEDAVICMSQANDLESFAKQVDEFDSAHHNYRQKDGDYKEGEPIQIFDFTTLPSMEREKDKYLAIRLYKQSEFENADGVMRASTMMDVINYSDYYFIRNASGEKVKMLDMENAEIEIPDRDIATFSYGTYIRGFENGENLAEELQANLKSIEGAE